MDIKINKEIRDYTENMILGLNIRQAVSCIIAIVISAGIYFLLKDILNIEVISWICIIAAFPPVFFGFFKYHELPAERIIYKIVLYKLQSKCLTYSTTSVANEIGKVVIKNEITNIKKHRKRTK